MNIRKLLKLDNRLYKIIEKRNYHPSFLYIRGIQSTYLPVRYRETIKTSIDYE